MIMNKMDDPIPISDLQHYAFCPRQYAYIHIERLWQDNYLTVKGNHLYERVNSNESEKLVNIKTKRSVQVSSERYGLVGQLDLLEIQSKPFKLTPVEYKRGKPKINDCDRIQLHAQAHRLFERIQISRITDGPARSFSDYKVSINEQDMPQGVTLEKVVG